MSIFTNFLVILPLQVYHLCLCQTSQWLSPPVCKPLAGGVGQLGSCTGTPHAPTQETYQSSARAVLIRASKDNTAAGSTVLQREQYKSSNRVGTFQLQFEI